jgi:hypothetical protein
VGNEAVGTKPGGGYDALALGELGGKSWGTR